MSLNASKKSLPPKAAAAAKSTIHSTPKGINDTKAHDAKVKAARDTTVLPTDPFRLTPYAQELVARRVMLAPVLVAWQYNVASHKRFTGWLGTREILMSDSRLGIDAELREIRYCGTYRVDVGPAGAGTLADGRDLGGTYRTLWGYTTEAGMLAVQRLATNPNGPTTIVQNDLIEFIATLKRFVAEAGGQHFSQDVLMGAAAG